MPNDERIIRYLQEKIIAFAPKTEIERVGRVLEVADGVARIDGLSMAAASEMLEFITKDNEVINGMV